MLSKIKIPGLFITGTDTGVGKTVISAAIANWFHRRNYNVAVCKPAATGCETRREGLVSEDAEFLAHCADARFPLNVICPQRFVEPLAPAVAAARSGVQLDWSAIDLSLTEMSRSSDVMIVEGIGGIRVPMDDKHTVLDMVKWLGLPTIIVARPALGTINHTLLTLDSLRSAGIQIAGVVINGFPADSPGVAEETNPAAIEKFGKTKVLCITPNEPFKPPHLPPGVISAMDSVDWFRFARHAHV